VSKYQVPSRELPCLLPAVGATHKREKSKNEKSGNRGALHRAGWLCVDGGRLPNNHDGHGQRHAMLTLSVVSLLAGAGLGLYCRILVLIPATAILLAVAIGTGVTPVPHTAWSIVLMVAAATTCIQIGYLVGVAVAVMRRVRRGNLWQSSQTPVGKSRVEVRPLR